MDKMLSRMVGAASLRSDTFEDVEHDRGATLQALLVVILVSISSGVGGLLQEEFNVVDALVFGVIGGVASWAVWALATWIVGTTILKTADTHADWGQLARGTGFAQTPGIFSFLVFIPWIGWLIALVIFVWRLAAMLIAVRQCLDYTSTWRAFFVVLIAAIPWLIIYGVVAALLGIGGD